MGSSKSNRLCTCVAVILGILLLTSLGGNSFLGYFYETTIPFTPLGIVGMFTDCSYCPACLLCLSGVSGEDVTALCDPLRNTFQCAVQLMYLYSVPNGGQPCYAQCSRCEGCLQKTTFGKLGKLNATMWETLFPNFVSAPEKMGFGNYSMRCGGDNQTTITSNTTSSCEFIAKTPGNGSLQQRSKRQEPKDLCCATNTFPSPYLTDHVDANGDTWHPVWFFFPWIPPTMSGRDKLQFYQGASCLTATSQCDNGLSCEVTPTLRTFVMTTKPVNHVFGYTFTLLTMPSYDVKFIDVDVSGYCRCVAS